MSVSHSPVCLSVCQPMCMSRGTLASMVAVQLVIYISGKSVLKHLSIISQLQLKAPATVPPSLEQAISLMLLSKFCVQHMCVCVCIRGSMGQLGGCGLQR